MTHRKPSLLSAMLTAALMIGCGDVRVDESSAVGGSGGSQVGGTGGTGGSSEPWDCDDYADEPWASPSVMLEFRNERDEIIYLFQWEGCPLWGELYTMEAPSGTNVGPAPFGGNCANPYATGGCESVHVTAIAPGGSFELDPGTAVYEDVFMPAECYGSSGGDDTIPCVKRFAAEPGTYVFHGLATTAFEGCDQDTASTCPCVGPAAGETCGYSFWHAEPAGEALTATVAIDYPATSQVALVFE